MTTETQELEDANPFLWTPSLRFVASLLIAFYLFVVLLGPMSNPVGTDNLTRPAAALVAPIHQALFLGHGYRFFGPDPGPSHLVYYKVKRSDGETIEGHFPDRDHHWPRLLYHRWFMLSETLYEQHAFTPDRTGFETEQEAFENEIAKRRAAGEYALVELLEKEKLDLAFLYEKSRERIDNMVGSLESYLLETHGGESIEVFLRERLLPEPLDVRMGVQLDDQRYLSPLIPIGRAAQNAPQEQDRLPPTTEATHGL